MKTSWAPIVLGLVLCSVWASAQETTGGVQGTITSQDGVAIPEVTMALEDPETGLARTVATSADGRFLFAAVPPGSYHLTATRQGFQTYRTALRVPLGARVSHSFEMALGAVTDVIEVSGDEPLMDMTSNVIGLRVGTDDLADRIPVAHDTQRLALLAPSAVAGDSGFNGESDFDYPVTDGQKLTSIGGASVAENSYLVNGLNITNFRNGLGSSWVPFDFVEEVQVKTGGYEAEFGRSTGGVVNMITKSGSNTLHGAFSLNYEPKALQETEPDTYLSLNTLEKNEVLEGNASLGGAILKDKLFFFGFVQYRDTDRLLNSTTTAERHLGREPYWGCKIDLNLTASHRLEATYLDDKTDIETRIYAIGADRVIESEPFAEGTRVRGGSNSILKYTGLLGENFLLSAQYGDNSFERTNRSTADVYPFALDYYDGSEQRTGRWASQLRGQARDEREAWRLDLDAFLGNHSLRAGLDYEQNHSDDETGLSGGIGYLYFRNDEGDLAIDPSLPPDQWVVLVLDYHRGGGFDVKSRAAYLRDSWSITPTLTLNAGIRWEMYENFNSDGAPFIKVDKQYAPRLGLVWDPAGQGRDKLYASFGKYYLPIASNINIRLAGGETNVQSRYPCDGYDQNGEPVNMDTGYLISNTIFSNGEVPDPRSTVDENIAPMSQNESILGYERLVGDDWSVGARVVAREFNEIIEDTDASQAVYNNLGIEVPPWPVLFNPGSGLTAWYDLDGDGTLDRVHLTADQLGYPDPIRKYYALEFTARRRFTDHWMLDAAYTWSHSYGNYEGPADSTIGQAEGTVTQLFDYVGLMDNAYGDLPNDRRHNLKVFGAYAWDNGLQVGGNFYFTTGRPISAQGVHPTDTFAASYGAASFYAQGVPVPRGSIGRTDDMWGLDASIKYTLQVSGLDVNLRLDVFNLFDNHAVTEVDEAADLAVGGAPNAEFLAPTHYQPPRVVRLGVGVNF